MQPGIYTNMSREEYFAIDSVSQSGLKDYARSPAHWLAAQRRPRKETDDMRLGNVIDCAILEPHLLESRYTVLPDFATGLVDDKGFPYKSPRATSKYKQLVSEFGRLNQGKEFVEPEWLESARGVAEGIAANEDASELLSGEGHNQVALVWIDPETGLLCKGLLDRLCTFQGKRVVVDVKSTGDVRFFEKACGDFGYAFQSAYYLRGLSILGEPAERFLHVVCERDDPYACEVRELDDESLDQGLREVTEFLALHAECKRTGHWPTKRSGVIPCRLPRYKFDSTGLES